MRHSSPATIGAGGETALQTPPGPGEGDFLTRVNATITNFKELGKIFMQFKGEQQQEEQPEPEPAPDRHSPRQLAENPQAKTPGLFDYVQLAIQLGYGDMPIGKLIEQISPQTLKEVMEKLKNAGLKK